MPIALPLHRRHAVVLSALATGLAIGVVAGPLVTADATVTPIYAGQYCAPKGAVYRAPGVTLLCAQAVSATRHVDPAWRWRDLHVGSCPPGYTHRNVAALLKVPRAGVKIVACVFIPPPSSPSPTNTRNGRPRLSPSPIATAAETTTTSPAAVPTPSPTGVVPTGAVG